MKTTKFKNKFLVHQFLIYLVLVQQLKLIISHGELHHPILITKISFYRQQDFQINNSFSIFMKESGKNLQVENKFLKSEDKKILKKSIMKTIEGLLFKEYSKILLQNTVFHLMKNIVRIKPLHLLLLYLE